MVTPIHDQKATSREAISMQRIAAVAALTVTMLAVPAAAAMASPVQKPSQACPAGHAFGHQKSFTFDVAPGSSTVYEVSGPTLASAEEFRYAGGTYTIWSVNPGAGSFTMSLGETVFVNEGPAITNATGYLVCSG
jgi:hypothetical protein